ncbi:MAG: hypothetical protein QM501_02440 [Gimesia sp.]
MLCWRTICYSLFSMISLLGSFNFAHAQTEVRNLKLAQSHLQRTAVIGLLGEFVQCAAYEVANPEHALDKLISQAHGFTPKSSGIIRVIRGGRISQDLLYSTETKFTLMHGDILVALPSPTNVVNISSQMNGAQGNRQQASSNLIQIAILNLLDRPVVFGVPPEMADMAGILHSLRQPLENFPQIAQTIKVIPPHRIGNQSNFKTNRLTSKFTSGTVLIVKSHKSIDLSLVPHSLPLPRRLQSTLAVIPKLQPDLTTPRTENRNHSLQKVIHPENITQPAKVQSPYEEKNQLQLNGPLLQQTAASLPVIPQAKISQTEEKADKPLKESESKIMKPSVSSTVPDLVLSAAPAPPQESIHVLDDADLSNIEEIENASTPFLPQWSYCLFLAVIAVVAWKFLSKRSREYHGPDGNQFKQRWRSVLSNKSKENATIIADWNTLPPMPKKSLLEQILENKIPVIEETPQIPTQTYIYGRHQSKSTRVDQQETLKGPHYSTRTERETRVPQTQETTRSVPAPSAPKKTEGELKASAFRFDRSHPGNSKFAEENAPHSKVVRPTSSKQKQTVQNETSVNTGVLDRVLQAVQGVINK